MGELTSVSNPPPPPRIVVASTSRKPGADETQVVAPLPPPTESLPKRSPAPVVELANAERKTADAAAAIETTLSVPRGRFGLARRTQIGIGLGVAVLVAGVLVVTIGFSNEGVKRESAPAGRDPTAAPRELEPRPAPSAPAPDPTSAPATDVAARPSDESLAADVAAQAPEPRAPKPAAPSHPPRPSRPHARVAQSPSPSAPPAHEPARAAKPAAQSHGRPTAPLTYDPDALFLKKKH